MRTDEPDNLETVIQALGPRVGEPWKVEDAKSRLTKLIRHCRDGGVELIGVQGEPVLMISCRELMNVAERLNGPSTWGELFERNTRLQAIDSPVAAAPMGRSPPPIDLEADRPERSVA